MSQDPFEAREAQKYDKPIPSREFILNLLEKLGKPATRDELFKTLELSTDDDYIALRRRLKAMERDGQLVYCRNASYALPDKLELVKGKVIGHKDGFGFVKPEEGGVDLFLPPKQMMSLFHGDYVLVQPVKVDARGRTEARLIRVLDDTPIQVVGRFFLEDGVGFVVPDDSRIAQDIIVPTEVRNGARHGQVVVTEITTRPRPRVNAIGKVIEILGQNMAPGMEVEIALRTHDIPHSWPDGIDKELNVFGDAVPEHAKVGRVDLRDLPLVTIDGEDARDFDDAVYCEKKPSGGWRLWVAIADVSYYVRHGSILDKEALNRGNSVYFPDQVIPMLPEKLSNGLCSLNPQVDRLCMVCEMTISAAGRLSGYKFYEAVMNSHARFTYTKVANILDGDEALREQYSSHVKHLHELHAMYQALKSARHIRGGMEFETQETRFIFNSQRKIEQIVPLHRNDAHKIIEECMIQANVSAARYIEKMEAHALFRVHETPGEEKLTGFRSFLSELGLELRGGLEPQPRDYADLADKIKERPDAELIQTMLLRSMKQAVYQDENVGHFGLALKEYAHFTSPIRRYPDLILHRAIKFQLAKEVKNPGHRWTDTGGYHYLEEDMPILGEQCSMTERRADDATRDVADFLKCEYMQDHVGDEMQGTIAAVTNFGFFVRLNDLHIDGLVHVTSLPGDYYQYDAGRQVMQGERTGRVFRIGDTLSVKVLSVNLDDKKIDFELAGEEGGRRRSGRKPNAAKGDDSTAKPSGRKPRGGSKRGGDRQQNSAGQDRPASEQATTEKTTDKPIRRKGKGKGHSIELASGKPKKKKTVKKSKRVAKNKNKAKKTK
ncbi:ribonuclease R [Motilimonas cestriensis]|uniref:Ribonuclease R n=1 Tax=Motilimonas cestriensis TaxID=2742685 RepID=A0ABS8W9X1_9GAMM|nr:ribonuclease R [Motilimonas cestriensis]MCE2595050.1 ribonuclease R [Motilimonas cestriensis]